jgi:hypothetical protein
MRGVSGRATVAVGGSEEGVDKVVGHFAILRVDGLVGSHAGRATCHVPCGGGGGGGREDFILACTCVVILRSLALFPPQ